MNLNRQLGLNAASAAMLITVAGLVVWFILDMLGEKTDSGERAQALGSLLGAALGVGGAVSVVLYELHAKQREERARLSRAKKVLRGRIQGLLRPIVISVGGYLTEVERVYPIVPIHFLEHVTGTTFDPSLPDAALNQVVEKEPEIQTYIDDAKSAMSRLRFAPTEFISEFYPVGIGTDQLPNRPPDRSANVVWTNRILLEVGPALNAVETLVSALEPEPMDKSNLTAMSNLRQMVAHLLSKNPHEAQPSAAPTPAR